MHIRQETNSNKNKNMRTVIIIGAMIIADAINPSVEISEKALTFVAVLVIASMVMALTEFIERNIK